MEKSTYPAHLYYSPDHEWLEKKEREALVGITAFAAGELGDIVYLDLPPLGSRFQAGEVFGTVEAVKTVSDLVMPVTGTILRVNAWLEQAPQLVNGDPYGDGWLIELTLDEPGELEKLMDAQAYRELTGQAGL